MRAIALFLLASAAFAQNGGSVAGKVSDDDGAAVAKAKIQANEYGDRRDILGGERRRWQLHARLVAGGRI